MQENHSSQVQQRSPLKAADPGLVGIIGLLEKTVFALLIVFLPARLRTNLQPIPSPPVFGDYTDVLFFLTDGLLLAMLAFWFIRKQVSGDGISWGPWFITFPMLGFSLAGFISAFFSVAPVISLMHVVRLGMLFVFYLYLVNEVRGAATLRIPLMLQVSLQSFVAITQHLLQRSIGLGFLGELELDPSRFGVSIVWAPGQIALRSYGLTDHPNILGGSLALALLFLIFTSTSSTERIRTPLQAVIALGAVALLLTFSRSAWLGFAVGAAFAGWILFRLGRTAELRRILITGLSAGIIVLPFIAAALPFLSSRLAPAGREASAETGELLSPEERSLEERAVLIDAANALFLENPLVGSGLGTFPLALQERSPEFEFDYQPVHFVLLDAAAETGLIGALGYLLALALPFLALRWARARLQLSDGLVAATAMLAAIAVIGLFDYYPWFLVPGRFWQWFAWGVWGALYRKGLPTHE